MQPKHRETFKALNVNVFKRRKAENNYLNLFEKVRIKHQIKHIGKKEGK